MKKEKLYVITNIQVGSLGFGNGNIGLIKTQQIHPKTGNHGLCKSDKGVYVENRHRITWKLNGTFTKPSLIEIIKFYWDYYLTKK